jgi:excisionase family DNA binding protein
VVKYGKEFDWKEAGMLMQEHEILDAEEVARLLRVHPRTIKSLANQRKLPGFKVGGQWRFRREAIDEYIRKQEHQGEQEGK